MASSNNIQKGKDGKYRWVYEVHLLKNYAILWEVYRMLAITCFICLFIIGCIGVCSDGLDALKMFKINLTTILIIVGVVAALGFLGYFLYAAICGWKYVVRFTMDEKQIIHEQTPMQAKKAKTISLLTVLAGLMAKRPGVVGAGMLAARTSSISVFSSVKRIIGNKRKNLIKVNETISRNQIYVDSDDFDFVYNFICEHCPNAKIS